MISFRYHLVSIIAVFLALALGIVVGTTALNGPITKDLRNQVNDLRKQRDGLAEQARALQGNVDDADQFASTYGDQLLSGTLKNKDVLVIDTPGASPSMQDGILQELAAAGAKVTGRLAVTKDYVDPRLGSQITSLATGDLHPLGLTYPETSDGGQLGGALLAYVLLGHGQQTDLTGVLGAFSEQHLLDVTGDTVTPATTVVVLGNGSLPANGYASATELALVSAIAKGGGHVVVAGDLGSASGGGLIAQVRDAAGDRSSVSTVDNADTSFGQVATVLALSAAGKGQVGQYGTGKGADALFPSPPR